MPRNRLLQTAVAAEVMVDKFLAMVEEGIQKHPLGAQPKSLYEPSRYIMTLGGKRLQNGRAHD